MIERAVFTAVAYILTSGCAWRYLPESFGVSPAGAHRRFSVWTEAGPWRRLHRAVLDELGARGELDWSSVIVDAASVRKKGVLLEALALAAAAARTPSISSSVNEAAARLAVKLQDGKRERAVARPGTLRDGRKKSRCRPGRAAGRLRG
ncbi:transposase [Streptomyces sp. NPDC093598]|uniref:transposase n=1 Tax=Streptomyces sp. NPDC093598 TaxID=3366046 RepID=UPI00380845E5